MTEAAITAKTVKTATVASVCCILWDRQKEDKVLSTTVKTVMKATPLRLNPPFRLTWVAARHLFYRGTPKSSKNKKNIPRTFPLVRALRVAAHFLEHSFGAFIEKASPFIPAWPFSEILRIVRSDILVDRWFPNFKSEVSKRGWRTEGVGARKTFKGRKFRPLFCTLFPMPP